MEASKNAQNQATKNMTTGEGGMMTTADPYLDRAVRILRQHGMDRSTADREKSGGTERERYLHTSTNYRMTDIQAAVGLVQLDRLEEIIARRRFMGARYGDAFNSMRDVVPPFEPDYARTAHQSYVVRFPGKAGQMGTVAALLRTKGVDTRPGIMCAHREVPYREAWPEGLLPESETAMDETLILPLYSSMTEGEQDRVLEALEEATRL